MYTQITDHIKVSVESIYQSEYSSPDQDHYMFAYKISIQNLGDEAVQLLRRHWWIFDSSGSTHEVEGEGVVGEQPIIEPGATHEYVSGCNLKTDIGSMWGSYLMIRESDQEKFEVVIPRFQLIAPFKLN